jgi:hypothetical protein
VKRASRRSDLRCRLRNPLIRTETTIGGVGRFRRERHCAAPPV